MKITTFLIIALALVSCDLDNRKDNPRHVSFGEQREFCGKQVRIENSGCKPCFSIQFDRETSDPDYIYSIHGVDRAYNVTEFEYSFFIAELVDARQAIDQVWSAVEKHYSDCN